MELGSFSGPSFFADHLTDALQFLSHLLIGGHDLIKGVRNFSRQSCPGARQTHGEITIPHGLEAGQNDTEVRNHCLRRLQSLAIASGTTDRVRIGGGRCRSLGISLHENVLLLK